mgnify:CR=1 FL=1
MLQGLYCIVDALEFQVGVLPSFCASQSCAVASAGLN